jgi:hypothetical protein
MKFIVYCTINLKNGKIYVGVHKTFTPHKFDGYLGNGVYVNGTGFKNKTPFQTAVKKYGADSFKRVTIAVLETEYEAYNLESVIVDEEFIKRSDTYNVLRGGHMMSFKEPVAKYDQGGRLLRVYDTKDEAAKEHGVTPSSINKSCETHKYSCMGYFWRNVKGGLPQAKIAVPTNVTELKRYSVPVVQYSRAGYKVKLWNSAKEAAHALHIDRATITAACRGRKKTLNGYQWRYASDEVDLLPPIEVQGGAPVAVLQLDAEGRLIASFKSIKEASDTVGLSQASIHKALKTGNMSKGFYWERV